ncbi:uncharacterized protein METZ01_LOCUS129036 [marine metagenome]|uniref:Uncharacterized protein n=1 Tax=marine metagenome TaxID=408172 RepID=A0A381YHU2_9ZZZZ
MRFWALAMSLPDSEDIPCSSVNSLGVRSTVGEQDGGQFLNGL